MGANKISAGEAYVAITCDNEDLVRGLRVVSNQVAETARTVSSARDELTPRLRVDGAASVKTSLETVRGEVKKSARAFTSSALEPRLRLRGVANVKTSLREVRDEMTKTTASASALRAAFVVTAGDAFNALKATAAKLSSALGTTGDDFQKMSMRTGLSSAALSEFAHAAEMSGASVSNVEGALRSMSTLTLNASNGVKKSAQVFAQLGINIEQFQRLDAEQQFETLARAVASVADPTTRAALAMKAFGSDGQALLPLFAAGPDGLRAMREEARALGVSIDDEVATMGADFVDATTRVKTAVRGAGLTIARVFTPAITAVANAVARSMSSVLQFANRFPTLTKVLVVAAGAFGTFSASSVVLTTGLAAVGRSLLLVKTSLSAVAAFAAANPFALLAAGVAAATVAIIALTRETDKYKQTAKDALQRGDDQRTQDRAALDRLRELQKQQKKNADEIAEAVKLAADLKSRYHGVGVEVDAVTGKIKIAGDAQAKMTAEMMKNKRAELAAALAEAESNAEGDTIAKHLAREEVSTTELAIGKKRGEGWGSYFTNFKSYANEDEARLAILENDDNFQKRVEAAKAANVSLVDDLRAQLAAMDAQLATGSAAASAGFDEKTVAEGFDKTKDFVAAGVEDLRTDAEKKIDEINKTADELDAALTRLADPNGEVSDWSDAKQVSAFLAKNPSAAALYEQAQDVRASASAQVQRVRDDEDKKRVEAETEAVKELERLERDRVRENMTDAERKIAAIDDETTAYLKQLDAVLKLKQEAGDVAGVVELRKKRESVVAESNARKDEARKKSAADAEAEQDRKNNALKDALAGAVREFGTPLQRLEYAAAAQQDAMRELDLAVASQDSDRIAAALGKLSDAAQNYEDSIDASRKIDGSVKSLGGTIDAWQASSLLASGSMNSKLRAGQASQLAALKSQGQTLVNNGALLNQVLNRLNRPLEIVF